MTGPEIDYAAVFQHLPIPVLLLTPDLIMADMTLAYLQKTGRRREDLVGRHVFDAFPDNPADPDANGVANLAVSLHHVLATGETHLTELQKYDVEVPGKPGEFARRYWSQMTAPILGTDGQVMLIAHCVEEVTDRLRRFVDGLGQDP